MAEPSLALNKAIFAHWNANITSNRLYSGVEQGAALPYTTLDTFISSSIDHLSERIDERFVFLTTWSQARGDEEVLRIIGEIDSAFHGAVLVLDTGSVVSIRVDRKGTRRDADNVTFSGYVTLRVITHH